MGLPRMTSTQFFVKAQAGRLTDADNRSYANCGATLGAKKAIASKDGKQASYGQAEVGAGTALSANLTLGYDRSLGKGFGVDLSANAGINSNLSRTNSYGTKIDLVSNDIHFQSETKSSFRSGDVSFSGRAMATKGGSWGNIGVGVEAGYRKALSPSIMTNGSAAVQKDKYIMKEDYALEIKPHEGAFVTPVVTANINLNKKGLQLTGLASNREQQVGIRYNF